MRTLTVAGAAICLLVLVRESTGGMHAQNDTASKRAADVAGRRSRERSSGSAAAANPAADSATHAGQGREFRHRSAARPHPN